MADNKQNTKVVDVPTVHEVYANQFIAAGFDGSSVTISLGTSRLMPEKMGDGIKEGAQPAVFVTARLAISAAAAVDFITNVSGMLERVGLMQNKGAPAGGAPGGAPAGGAPRGDTWGR